MLDGPGHRSKAGLVGVFDMYMPMIEMRIIFKNHDDGSRPVVWQEGDGMSDVYVALARRCSGKTFERVGVGRRRGKI